MGKEERRENPPMKTVAIIPAAGAGVRMGVERAKQFLEVEGSPLLALTLEKFQGCSGIDSIIVVVPPGEEAPCRREIVDRFHFTKVEKVVAGGERRQDSVRLGIEASGGQYGMILIHDGVRPLVSVGLIEQVLLAGAQHRAVATGLPAKETVKEIDSRGLVIRTYNREQVWMIQTPQAFRYEDIFRAHRQAFEEGWGEVTDDAHLAEKMGIPVKVIEGSEENIKVTTPHDLELVQFLMNRQRD